MSKNDLWGFGSIALAALVGCSAQSEGPVTEEESEPSPGVDELKSDDDSPGIDSTEQGLHNADPVLVGRWRFNEDGGQILRDSSGRGNNAVRGTNVNVQASDPRRIFVDGHRALDFDGNDVARVIGRDGLQPREVTVAAWVRFGTAPTGTQYLVSKGAEGCVAPSYALYFDNGQLKFIVTPETGNFRETNGYPATNIDDNDWHQVIGTYNGRAVRLYVDGDLVDVSDYGTDVGIRYGLSQHNRLQFGAFSGAGLGCSLNYNGELDNVRVYRNPLNANEVMDRWEGREIN